MGRINRLDLFMGRIQSIRSVYGTDSIDYICLWDGFNRLDLSMGRIQSIRSVYGTESID